MQNITNTTQAVPFTVNLQEIERHFRATHPDEALNDMALSERGAFLVLYAIDEWSRSSEAARCVWQAWADGMREQDRVVPAGRQAWLGLETRDKKLDGSIAVHVIKSAIAHITGVPQ
jgi:hypothetical protein